MLDTDQPSVLAHCCDWQGQVVLVLHNLGPEPVQLLLELGDVGAGSHMAELLADQHYEPAETGQPLALDGFGYRWLRPPG